MSSRGEGRRQPGFVELGRQYPDRQRHYPRCRSDPARLFEFACSRSRQCDGQHQRRRRPAHGRCQPAADRIQYFEQLFQRHQPDRDEQHSDGLGVSTWMATRPHCRQFPRRLFLIAVESVVAHRRRVLDRFPEAGPRLDPGVGASIANGNNLDGSVVANAFDQHGEVHLLGCGNKFPPGRCASGALSVRPRMALEIAASRSSDGGRVMRGRGQPADLSPDSPSSGVPATIAE